jgi:Tol biopolymer transport system component
MPCPRAALLAALLLAAGCGGGSGGSSHPCGASGEACCATGDACATGLVCASDDTCVALPACGASGEACCANDTCNTGLACLNSTTCGQPPVVCGGSGQACCAGSACDANLACTAGTCETPPPPCGASGQACCANDTCNTGLACNGTSCATPCGATSEACCATDPACEASLLCTGGTCQAVPCGMSGDLCCAGALACDTGLVCNSDLCAPTTCALDETGATWIGFTRHHGGNYDIDLVHADGSCRTGAVSDPAIDVFPAFSPAGLLTFSSTRGGAPSLYTWDTGGAVSGIPILDAQSHAVAATAPACTPDGRWIAFEGTASGASRTDVYLVFKLGGTATPLTSGTGNNAGPVVSPDGTTVFFVSNRSGAYWVYSVPVGGGSAVQVPGTNGILGRPALSPDGKRLAFARFNTISSLSEVVARDLVAGTQAVVSGQGDSEPAFDQTGTRLVVVSVRGGDPALWTLDAADGSRAIRVTTPAGEVHGQPAFRP